MECSSPSLCYRLHTVVVICLLFAISSVLHAQTMCVRIHHRVDGDSLILNTKEYRNALGQSYTVDRLKYYLSAMSLIAVGRDQRMPLDSSRLIDEEDESSKSFCIPSQSSGMYRAFEFLIGVDSAHNCAGLQEGALDPVHGMFWAWNTGYIFFKFDGHAATSSAPARLLEYHIGGFREAHNALRRVRIDFGKNMRLDSVHTLTIDLDLNLAELFRSPSTIDFRTIPTVTDINNNTLIADNYQDCFVLRSVLVEGGSTVR